MSDENQNPTNGGDNQQWYLSDDSPTAPTVPQVPAAGRSRRTFLKAALVGTAGVAAVGGAAGAVLSGRAHLPGIFPVAPTTPVASGTECISLIEAFHADNSNSNIVIDASFLDSFGTAAPPNGNADRPVTFTRCGSGTTIYFQVTDSNSGHVAYGRLLSGSSYIDGHNGKLFLVVDHSYLQGDITGGSAGYNTGSCLKVNCKKWPIQP